MDNSITQANQNGLGGRIHELELMRQKKTEERGEEPIQISLWDVEGKS